MDFGNGTRDFAWNEDGGFVCFQFADLCVFFNNIPDRYENVQYVS
jgi:hypothetical protein